MLREFAEGVQGVAFVATGRSQLWSFSSWPVGDGEKSTKKQTSSKPRDTHPPNCTPTPRHIPTLHHREYMTETKNVPINNHKAPSEHLFLRSIAASLVNPQRQLATDYCAEPGV